VTRPCGIHQRYFDRASTEEHPKSLPDRQWNSSPLRAKNDAFAAEILGMDTIAPIVGGLQSIFDAAGSLTRVIQTRGLTVPRRAGPRRLAVRRNQRVRISSPVRESQTLAAPPGRAVQ